jgi:hypothetical protein
MIRRILGTCEAMDLNGLVRSLAMDRDVVERELERLVDRGEVEVLSPLFFGGRAPNEESRRRNGKNHYRLIRATDDDSLWEEDLVVRLPPGRLFDARQLEQHGEARASAAWQRLLARFREPSPRYGRLDHSLVSTRERRVDTS